MRSSRIIWVGPKSNDKCPYKRHIGRDTERRRGGNVTTDAETGVMWPQARDPWTHQKLKGTRNRLSPRASRGSVALPTT